MQTTTSLPTFRSIPEAAARARREAQRTGLTWYVCRMADIEFGTWYVAIDEHTYNRDQDTGLFYEYVSHIG